PGNVRQLENEIRRALLLAEGTIEVSDLSATGDGPSPAELTLDVRTRIDRLEEELVTEALARTDGNQTQAAKLLGLSRYGLHKMMRRLNLKD
ncbi:MAG: sigma-54-dependent Fis family transcriptional regulator, partial [Myxococcales bacterium]|nr:sigma-54-dependent Fis family transcriptional regulator [Myxococcales bacterium]